MSSAKVAYAPPPVLSGIALVVVGAILINQGMNVVGTSNTLIVGIGLLAAGALLVFAGVSRVWPRSIINIGIFIAGILILVTSGNQLQFAADWGTATYGIILTLVGIALIVIGVQIARQSWKRYVEHR